MQDKGEFIPPPSDHDYPAREAAKVRETLVNTLKTSSKVIWNNGANDDGELKWELLTAPAELVGEQRLDAQYWRVNIDPTERYELAVAGSSVYRLYADQSGFDNLIITGAWINNGFKLGCVEAAAMSGLLACRALTGLPQYIVGLDEN